MPRKPNTRQTNIYWLFDNRTGLPFYCGKTVFDPARRLSGHRKAAVTNPQRLVSQHVQLCGDNISIRVVEVVPPSDDWAERERFWIAKLRREFPNNANTTSGGQGAPGMVHTESARAKMTASRTGKKLSPEHCQNISAANKGRPVSDEERARISAGLRSSENAKRYQASRIGKKHSEETKRRIGEAHCGRKRAPFSEEWKANMGAVRRGVPKSEEHKRKIAEAKRGVKRAPFSEEWKANMRASRLRRVKAESLQT